MQYYSAAPGGAAVYSVPANYPSTAAAYTYSNAPSASGTVSAPAVSTSYGAAAAAGSYGLASGSALAQQPQQQQQQQQPMQLQQQQQQQVNYTIPNTYQYVTDGQGNQYSVQSYSPAPQQAYGGYAYPAPQAQAQPQVSDTYNNLQSLPSMVAYPGAPGYYPTSISSAWDHHLEALEQQSIGKLIQDFDDSSVVRFFNFTTSDRAEYQGLAKIREFFPTFWKDIKENMSLSVDLAQMEESSRTVFACWRCLPAGYTSVSATYFFGQDCKIKSLNIAVTKEAARPSTRSKKKEQAKKTKSFCWGS